MPDPPVPDPSPTHSLVSWVRRGLSSLISGTSATNYVSLPVALSVNGAALNAPSVRLFGPGDIKSLDARAIIRTDPRDGTDAFEPNYLAMAELLLPDLPWMFTPATSTNGRLRPWICLLLVPDADGVTVQAQPAGPAPWRLSFSSPIDPRNELPNLDQIDAFAHAQVIGDNLSGDNLSAALEGNNVITLARLISPRHLEPGKRYIACIVPTYRAGVNAGLGLPVDDNDLAPAWDANTSGDFTLPVYYQFRFQTGPDGDFASLARRIQPPKATLNADTRPMDGSDPGFGLNPIANATLLLEGALRTWQPGPQPPVEWPPDTQAPYQSQLRGALIPPAGSLVVSPPTYGRAGSGSDLPAENAPPIWLRELNLDPRTRTAAGAGAQVVRRDQDALVASAWNQVGEIRKANQLLRQAQLARQVSTSLNQRHLQSISGDGVYLQVTAPLQSRVSLELGGAKATLRAHIQTSRVPTGAVSQALRKLARPRGPIGRSIYIERSPEIVDRLNLPVGHADGLVVAGPVQTPRGMVAFDDVSPSVQINKMTTAILQIAAGWKTSVTAPPIGPVATPTPSPVSPTHIGPAVVSPHPLGPAITAARPLVDWSSDSAVPDILKQNRPNLPPPLAFPSDQAGLTKMEDNFRGAATTVIEYLNAAPPPFAPDPLPLGGSDALAPVRMQLASQINPEDTIRTRLNARFPIRSGPDPLQPFITGPQFPQPTYSALAELSPEWMLPGVANVLLDTAALLQTNPRFVEAFLLGLNEELARELLWREFPADCKATYFQTFWGASAGGAHAPDIPPIATFDPSGHIGDHVTDHATGGELVLLIRGELFRRYPNAIVSAVQAAWSTDGHTPPQPVQPRILGTNRSWPIFRGQIASDIFFFGFKGIDDPKGVADPSAGNAGWYFVIEEHVSEPRFGLADETEDPSNESWNALRWNDVVLDRGVFLNPASAPPPPVPAGEVIAWGQDAAAMAYILMRRPVRVALHARALLGSGGV